MFRFVLFLFCHNEKLSCIFFAETDMGRRNLSFENKVSEMHVWLSSAETKLALPVRIGDADEMDRAAQQHSVSGNCDTSFVVLQLLSISCYLKNK